MLAFQIIKEQLIWTSESKVMGKTPKGILENQIRLAWRTLWCTFFFLLYELYLSSFWPKIMWQCPLQLSIHVLALLDQWITQNKSNVICCVDMYDHGLCLGWFGAEFSHQIRIKMYLLFGLRLTLKPWVFDGWSLHTT